MPEATHNRVTLLGRLTRDPEIRSLEGGDQVATFSVATTDTWRNRAGEPQERSQFHPVVIWNQALIEAMCPISKRVRACCWTARSSIAATTPNRRRATSRRSCSGPSTARSRCSTAPPHGRPPSGRRRARGRRPPHGASSKDKTIHRGLAGQSPKSPVSFSATRCSIRELLSRKHQNSTRTVKFPRRKPSTNQRFRCITAIPW